MQSRSVRWKLVDVLGPDYEDAAGKAAILRARARGNGFGADTYIPAAVHRHRRKRAQNSRTGKWIRQRVSPPISTDKPNLFTEIDGFNCVPGHYSRRVGGTRPTASCVGSC